VLLKTHFYITEGLQQRNKLLFYRHRVQQKISDQALLEIVRNKQLHRIDKETAGVLAKAGTFMGEGVLRFVPKKTGPRPIVNIRYCCLLKKIPRKTLKDFFPKTHFTNDSQKSSGNLKCKWKNNVRTKCLRCRMDSSGSG
jgi:hypothetical protein